jgi:hypothetical protein
MAFRRVFTLSTVIWALSSSRCSADSDIVNYGYVSPGGPEVFLKPAPSYGGQ